ncbi:MAG: outer membrane protein assembly factor BamE [Burkholderiales bacterium]|jgi:hypothetical protein|nr:outer membrane protein assembly factor BamE [Burkholderiales bacterium]
MRNKSFRSVPVVAFLGSSLIALAPPATAATEIYKCAGEGDIPIYQNIPCEKGKELRNMTGEDTLSVVPMRVEPSRLPPLSPVAPPPAPTTAEPAIAPLPDRAPITTKEVAPPLDLTPSSTVGIPEATPFGAAALTRMTVKPGMTIAEVEASLGPPPMTGGGDNPDQPTRWFYFPTEGDEETITTIVFLHGKVTEVERKPMKRN